MFKLSGYNFKFCILFQIIVVLLFSVSAFAAGEQKRVQKHDWTFAGIFGHYDDAQLQRGFQVYREVCSSCHSMNYVYYRNLAEEGGPGFTVEEVKVIASEDIIIDGPDDYGEMFERPGKPSDKFVSHTPIKMKRVHQTVAHILQISVYSQKLEVHLEVFLGGLLTYLQVIKSRV